MHGSQRAASAMRRDRYVLRAFLVYGVAVGLIVFWPSADIATNSVYYIWRSLDRLGAPGWLTPGAVEFITNVLLFVPLGILGSLLRPGWPWYLWGAVGLTATTLIELSQLLLLDGRSAMLGDMVANTLGAIAGSVTVILLRSFSR